MLLRFAVSPVLIGFGARGIEFLPIHYSQSFHSKPLNSAYSLSRYEFVVWQCVDILAASSNLDQTHSRRPATASMRQTIETVAEFGHRPRNQMSRVAFAGQQ